MLKSKVIPGSRLLLICTVGKMHIDQHVAAVTNATSNPAFDPTFDTLFDLRNSDLEVSRAGLNKMIRAVQTTPGFKAERRTAFVTSQPNHVVMAELLSRPQNQLPIEIRVFSTLEAAMTWLSPKGVTVEYVRKALDELMASLSTGEEGPAT